MDGIEERPERYRALMAAYFDSAIPFIEALDMRVTDAGDNYACMHLPFSPKLVADPVRGLIHTGVMTALVDSASGLAVFCALPEMQSIATLDLRMDYLRPAIAELDLRVRAECFRLTRNIAFTRAEVHQGDKPEPVAVSNATFMRSASRRSRREHERTS